MSSKLLSLDEATRLLSGPGTFLVAADEKVLRKLPKGNWAGGTIPYFMAAEGGVINQDKVFVTEMPKEAKLTNIKFHGDATIKDVYKEIPSNGFGVIIVPALTPMHLNFAMNAPTYQNFAVRPLVGWISGVHLNELGKNKPQTMNGQTGVLSSTEAIVVNFDLPQGYVCDVGIVNIFHQGTGDKLEFPETGFDIKDVLVNGTKRNFSEYLIEKKIDTKNPLVANYGGAMINASFQANDEKAKVVHLYAPVFKGTEYRLAAPVGNYVENFTKMMPKDTDSIAFSCNCILNFLYSELEGKKTGTITGPITFGEIAYQLLNQTLVHLNIIKL